MNGPSGNKRDPGKHKHPVSFFRNAIVIEGYHLLSQLKWTLLRKSDCFRLIELTDEHLTECGRKQSWEQLNFDPAASRGNPASVGLAVLGESFESMALHLFLSHMIAAPLEKFVRLGLRAESP